MFGTFLVMAAIEISLLIDKPNARYFAVTILAVGLILRGLVQERRMKREAPKVVTPGPNRPANDVAPPLSNRDGSADKSILCAVRSAGRTLDFALREAAEVGSRLYVLFVREQPFMTEQDVARKWPQDHAASEIFDEAKRKAERSAPSSVML